MDQPEALEKMPSLYSTEKQEVEEHLLLLRFYHPLSKWSWYAVEYDPKERLFFGLTDGFEREWGYFSLTEMAFTEVSGVPVMWDVDFKPVKFGELKGAAE